MRSSACTAWRRPRTTRVTYNSHVANVLRPDARLCWPLRAQQSLQSMAEAAPRSPRATAMGTIPEPGESPFQRPPLPPPPSVRDLMRTAFARASPPQAAAGPSPDPDRVQNPRSGEGAAWLAGLGPRGAAASGPADALAASAGEAEGAGTSQSECYGLPDAGVRPPHNERGLTG